MRSANRWYTVPALLMIVLAAGCSNVLDVKPINDVDESDAITNPGGARAAVAGLYDALQDFSYYGGELFFFGVGAPAKVFSKQCGNCGLPLILPDEPSADAEDAE